MGLGGVYDAGCTHSAPYEHLHFELTYVAIFNKCGWCICFSGFFRAPSALFFPFVLNAHTALQKEKMGGVYEIPGVTELFSIYTTQFVVFFDVFHRAFIDVFDSSSFPLHMHSSI